MKLSPTTIDLGAAKPATANPAPCVNRLIMSIGDKGGSGKSFVIRALAGIHLAAGTNDLLLIDGDSTVGTLVKFFGDRDGVEQYSLHGKLDERDRIVNELLLRGARLVIVDLPATSLTRMREMAVDYNFADAAAAAGYRLTVVSPITPYDDSILDLQDAIALFDPQLCALFDQRESAVDDADAAPPPRPAPRVDYVAVINLGLGEDRSDFALWDDPHAYTRRLFEFAGGVQLELPALRPRIAALLQKHRLTFAQGETSGHLSVTDRGRLQRWNVGVSQALRCAPDRLGFS